MNTYQITRALEHDPVTSSSVASSPVINYPGQSKSIRADLLQTLIPATNPEHTGLPSTSRRKKRGNSSIATDMHPNTIGNHLETFLGHVHGTLISVNCRVHGRTYVASTVYFTLVIEQGVLV